MHKFHTLQCKNNKLLLSNHHLLCLWHNIYTLWGSSSSVCDGEHFVLKIHNGLTRTALCLSKNLVAKLHTMIMTFMFIKPTRINLKGVCNSTLTQKCCRSISCCPSKHHLVMAPKASSTCMPKNTRPLASPSFPISFNRSLIVKNSEILDFPTSKLIKSVELITRIHL